MERYFENETSEGLIAELGERYQIGKSQIYNRFRYGKIEKIKEDGKVFLSESQVKWLDELDEHIKGGGSLEEFHILGTLVHSNGNGLTSSEETVEFHEEAPRDYSALIRAAQEKAAGNLIAQNLLAGEFSNNPHLLDADLKEQVERSEKASYPKGLKPSQYAQQLASFYKSPS